MHREQSVPHYGKVYIRQEDANIDLQRTNQWLTSRKLTKEEVRGPIIPGSKLCNKVIPLQYHQRCHHKYAECVTSLVNLSITSHLPGCVQTPTSFCPEQAKTQ